MEANHKRNGFMRSSNRIPKSLFRISKPSKPMQYGNSKVSPNPTNPNDSVHYYPIRQSYYANPPSIQKVPATKLWSFPDCGGDVNVEKKATSYILSVRERFKLERADLEALQNV
ncbi:hypothetical protein Tsubulata_002171 [Turnera subulata]|uniref:Uncharacterized protein n=1 Tax=Turnera subulata TaxID=218843 RepID=A0A9Q0FNM8_9ROSI|nr:hypothetical protein Tsubulata_002171 [Turnera subulata]